MRRPGSASSAIVIAALVPLLPASVPAVIRTPLVWELAGADAVRDVLHGARLGLYLPGARQRRARSRNMCGRARTCSPARPKKTASSLPPTSSPTSRS